MKVGDEVVTVGGCFGKVVQVNDDTIVLDVDRGVKLTFSKESVSMDYSKKTVKTTA